MVGTNPRTATYASGTGTTKLIFEYTVIAEDTDTDGISIAADAITLDSDDKIQDSDDQAADLTFTAVAADTAHKVDGSLTPPPSKVAVSFGAASYTATEGGDAASVVVNLGSALTEQVEVRISRADQDGATGRDYSGVPSSLTFDAGDTKKTITVTATDDISDDDGESVKLSFKTLPVALEAGSIAETTVNFADNESPVADSTTTLVGNHAYTQNAFDTFFRNYDLAQRFRTGSVGGGYVLTSVELHLLGTQPLDLLDVELWSDSGGNPGMRLATFIHPSAATASGTLRFRAAERIVLAANTGYFIRLDNNSTSGDMIITLTPSNNQDGLAGWLIDDHFRRDSSNGWEQSTTTGKIRVQLRGNQADTAAPALETATVNRRALVLTYDEALDEDSEPAAGAYEVTAAGRQVSVSTVSVSGSTVTLTLGASVTPGQTVTMDYTVPGSNPVQDTSGNDAPSLTDQTVTNNSTANTAPTAANGEVTTDEDVDYTFKAADFNFSDANTVDALVSVKIESLPTGNTGTLKLDGAAIDAANLPQTVTRTQLDDKKLVYDPPDDANGDDYASFNFKVSDGDADSASSYTMTVDVNPVVDVTNVAVTSTPLSGTADPKDTYGVGETIQVTVTFEEAVDVAGNPGNPTLAVTVGTETREATYKSGTGTTALVFEYTVVAADTDSNGISIAADALTLDANDRIEDSSDNAADLIFTAVGNQAAHKVNGSLTPPKVAVSFGAASYTATEGGTDASVVVSLGSALAVEAVVPIETTNEGGATDGDYSGVPSSLTFAAGDTEKTITVTATDDVKDDDGESVKLGFGTLPLALQAGSTAETTVALADDENPVADSTTTLVGNQDHAQGVHTQEFGRDVHAQRFMTGPASGGYVLTSVELPLGGNLPLSRLRVELRSSNASGNPVDRLATFIHPDTENAAGTLRFRASERVELAANTGYFIYLVDSVNTGASITVALTTSADEDGLPGFSIDNRLRTRNVVGTWFDGTAPAAIRMQLRGDPVDMTAPTLETATVDGTALVLTYDEALDEDSEPGTSAYEVTVGGSAATVSTVSVDDKTVTLTLATAAQAGQTVSLGYTVPGSDPVQDLAGNDAVALTGEAVTNNTANVRPRVANEIPNQSATVGTEIDYAFPANTFSDTDTTQTLTYKATQGDDSDLPAWLTFAAATRTFSGTPAVADIGTLTVKVTVNDGNGGTESDTFDIEVSASKSGAPQTFSATAGNTQVTLAWTAPASDGGAAITKYQYRHAAGTTVPNDTTWTDVDDSDDTDTDASNETGVTVTSLTNGTEYAFEVRAVNSIGGGATAGPETATPNAAPTVANAIPNQSATAGTMFSYQFSTSTFADTDTTDTLTYTATKSDGALLPTWLSFNAATRTFSGTPMAADVGALTVKVTASDGNGGTVSDEFNIHVSAAPGAETTLVSNTGQSQDSSFGTTRNRAQRFETGAHANDYTLSSVEIVSTDFQGDDMAISVCETDASGFPTSECRALDAPNSFAAGTLAFNAPAGTPIVLKANTAYTVLVTSPGGQTLHLSVTDSNAEDARSAPGWKIADSASLWSGTAWEAVGNGIALRIAVKGTARAANTAATGTPTISGTPRAGETLTANAGTGANAFADADGLPTNTFPDGYTFQWVRVDGVNETDIDMATDRTYTLVNYDVNETIKVKVSFTDRAGYSETLVSAATDPIAPRVDRQSNTIVLVSNIGQTPDTGVSLGGGEIYQGFMAGSAATLASIEVRMDDLNGGQTNLPTMTLHTSRTAAATATLTATATLGTSATNVAYTALAGTALTSGETYYVKLTGGAATVRYYDTASANEDSGGQSDWSIQAGSYTSSTTLTPSATALLISVKGTLTSSNNAATGAPTISGVAQEGQTLTANAGTGANAFADADGLPTTTFPTGYTFQWVRVVSGVDNDITGETSRTYTLTSTDVGHTVKVKVSFTDRANNPETLTSAATSTVSAAPSLQTLVSNIGISQTHTYTFGTQSRAQQFRAGSNTNGYTLNSIELRLKTTSGTDVPTVKVFSGSANGTEEATLNGPTSLDASTTKLYTFTVTAGETVTLDASTDYWVVANGGSSGLEWTYTTFPDEDTAAPDWSIHNKAQWRNAGDTGGFTDFAADGSMMLRVKGYANTSTNVAASGAPEIEGFAQVGQTLTATAGNIMDTNGLPTDTFPAGYTFQWVRDVGGVESDIASATSHEYTLVAADLGNTLKVKASFMDGAGNSEGPLSSAVTDTVIAAPAACDTGNLWCATLTVGFATTDDSDGVRSRGYCGAGTGTDPCNYGALSEDDFDIGTVTYTVESIRWGDEVTDRLHLTLDRDFAATGGLTLKVESHQYDIWIAGQAPASVPNNYRWSDDAARNVVGYAAGRKITVQLLHEDNTAATGTPTITGTAQVGQTLTAGAGTGTNAIADTDGLPRGTFPTRYTFQWVRFDADGTSNRTEISGATSQTYVLADDDAGKTIKVEVSFTDDLGYSETRTSDATAAIAAATTATEVPSNWGLIPSGLTTGDTFRLLVVTSNRQTASASNIASYNTFVQNDVSSNGHADIRSHSADFRVLGCTQSTTAIANTSTGSSDTAAPIYWLNGAKVADNYTDLYDGGWDSNVPKLSSGSNAPTAAFADRVYNGCRVNGTSSGMRYLGASQSSIGIPWTQSDEFGGGGGNSSGSHSIYGLSGIFGVAADNTAPALTVTDGATVDGTSLVLTYNEALDGDSTPTASQYTVTVDGNTVTVSSVSVDGMKVTLTLATAVTSGQTVTVSYTVPGSNPVQDTAGNDAPALSSQTVTNNTANNAPTAANGEVTTNEDVDYTFKAGDFKFSDTDADDALVNVKIVTLPGTGKGMLALDGTAIAASALPQTVTKAQLDDNKLVYKPPQDANGNDYTSFTFKVNDGDDDSTSDYTMTIDVDPVPDVTDVAVTSTPISGSADPKDTYGVGETIEVTVTFDENVDVTGAPTLAVMVGTNTRTATYASGTGTTKLVFEYTVVAADTDSNGISIAADAITVDSSNKIEDSDDQAADLTFAAVSADTAHKVNGALTPPKVTVSFGADSYTATEGGDAASVVVSLGEALTAEVVVPIETTNQGGASNRDYSGVPSSLTFTAGDTEETITVTATDDVADDDDESVKLAFGTLPEALRAGSITETTVTLADNENPVDDSTTTLVNNLDQSGNSSEDVRNSDAAQRFRTGSSSDGYVLTSVELQLGVLGGTPPLSRLRVELWSDSSGNPGSRLATFIHPSTGSASGIRRFRASQRIVLVADTGYFIRLGDTGTDGGTIHAFVTNSDNESGLPDWIIDNRYRSLVSGGWILGSVEAAVKMRLRGDPVDMTAPALETATVDGTSLVLTYDEALHEDSEPATGAYTVTVGGSAATVSAVSVDDMTVTLTLATAVTSGQTVSLNYTVPGSNPVQDLAANDAVALSSQTVTNNTAPTFSSASVDGDTLVITFDAALAAASNLANSAFTVKKTPDGESEATVSLSGTPSISGAKVTLTLAAAVVATDGSVKVSYTKPGTDNNNRLENAAGNEVASFTDQAVTNATTTTNATGAPTISGVAQVGQTLTANAGNIDDTDGLPADTFPTGYTFQWVRVVSGVDSDITGQTSRTYTLATADVGNTVKVKVSFTDGANNPETLTSAAHPTTGSVLSASACAAPDFGTRRYFWTGNLTVGEGSAFGESQPFGFQLGDFGTLAEDSFTVGSIEYVITATLVTTGGSASGDFAFELGDDLEYRIGGSLRLHVCAVDFDLDDVYEEFYGAMVMPDQEESKFAWEGTALNWSSVSSRTLYLSLPANNAATGAPAITGTAQVGETLTANAGTIADTDGLPAGTFPTGYSFQWVRIDSGVETDIPAATSRTYVLTNDDLGKTVKVKVSFKDRLYVASYTQSGTMVTDAPLETRESAASNTVTADTTDPALATTGPATVDGTSLVLTYNEALDGDSTPMASQYTVTVDGNTVAVSSVSVDGMKVTLTLAMAVTSGQTVTVSYTVPGSNPVQDTAGNDAPALSSQTVTNNAAPTFSSASVDGDTLVITFDATLAAAANLDNSAFTVKKTPSGESEATVSLSGTPAISGATVTLTLAAAVVATDGSVKVSYTKPGTDNNNRLEDAAGNEVASFTDQAVTNATTASSKVSVSFGADSYTATEGGDAASVVVSLGEALTADVVVPIETTNEGGASDGDYSGVPSSLTFTAGDTEETITVTATNDVADDDNESVKLGFGTLPAALQAGSTAETTVNLADNENPVADSTTTLVTNQNHVQGRSAVSFRTYDIAQRFMTGPSNSGYVLKSVSLPLSESLPLSRMEVELWSDSSGNPGTRLATFIHPSDETAAGERRFRALRSGSCWWRTRPTSFAWTTPAPTKLFK